MNDYYYTKHTSEFSTKDREIQHSHLLIVVSIVTSA